MRYTLVFGLWLCLTNMLQMNAMCSCKPLDIATAYESADLIIEGQVVRVTTNWMSGGWKYTFKVSQSWKRNTDRVLFINSAWEKDCGYIFREGERYVVFIEKGFTMKTRQCMGNVSLEKAEATLRFLGDGSTPVASPQIPYINTTLIFLAVLALAFVSIVVLRKRLFPSK